jgi:shikimate kinase
MKILLFGISNIGKTTLAKLLSIKLGYQFDDLDEEIIRRYEKIDKFQAKYPNDIERHQKRGEILENIINKYDDNVVISVSVINYTQFFEKLIDNKTNILSIELQDKPENIIKRLVYADENDKIHPIKINNEKEEMYYLNDINEDIKYYSKIYKNIKNKFNINGDLPEIAVERLQDYIQNILPEG